MIKARRFWRYKIEAESEAAVFLAEESPANHYRLIHWHHISYPYISKAVSVALDKPAYAVGMIDDANISWQETPDHLRRVSALLNMKGHIFISRDGPESLEDIPAELEVKLGLFEEDGWGSCKLHGRRSVSIKKRHLFEGTLLADIPERMLNIFDVRALRPRYGYIFLDSKVGGEGNYERALMRGSIVKGPKFLVD